MDATVLAGILGGIGGITRGFVGLLKALSMRRRILWGYYAITVLVALVIGVFVGIVFNFDPRLSLLAGYAGTDILEGIYKSFAVQKVYMTPSAAKAAATKAAKK
jgi:fluoride ion exporter CrcB/FEX